jgi:catechol 2,3-dioxygenase-like lactoylglutathione lyase family enzyme
MISKSHFILYVQDQIKSSEFYSKLLNQKPALNVPGMTEFKLADNSVLGLMPAAGINKLLNNDYKAHTSLTNSIKAEVYLMVDSVEEYCDRAKLLNVPILKNLAEMDWGHRVIYFKDPDNYVLALAEVIEG